MDVRVGIVRWRRSRTPGTWSRLRTWALRRLRSLWSLRTLRALRRLRPRRELRENLNQLLRHGRQPRIRSSGGHERNLRRGIDERRNLGVRADGHGTDRRASDILAIDVSSAGLQRERAGLTSIRPGDLGTGVIFASSGRRTRCAADRTSNTDICDRGFDIQAPGCGDQPRDECKCALDQRQMTGISRAGVDVENEFIQRHPRVRGQIEGGSVKQTNPKIGIASGLNDVRLVHGIADVEGHSNAIADRGHRTRDLLHLSDNLSGGCWRRCLRVLGWRARGGERFHDFCGEHCTLARNQVWAFLKTEIIKNNKFLAVRSGEDKIRSRALELGGEQKTRVRNGQRRRVRMIVRDGANLDAGRWRVLTGHRRTGTAAASAEIVCLPALARAWLALKADSTKSADVLTAACKRSSMPARSPVTWSGEWSR